MKQIETYDSDFLESFESEISEKEFKRVENKMKLAAAIDDALKAKGFTYASFAREMDQQPSVITRWLSGTHNFTVDTLSDIGLVLGIDLINLDHRNRIEESKFVFISGSDFEKSISEACYELTLTSMSNKTKTSASSNTLFYKEPEFIS